MTLCDYGLYHAKIGADKDKEHGCGKFGLGDRNERGDRLVEFCCANNLIIMNTYLYTLIITKETCTHGSHLVIGTEIKMIIIS